MRECRCHLIAYESTFVSVSTVSQFSCYYLGPHACGKRVVDLLLERLAVARSTPIFIKCVAMHDYPQLRGWT